ncbi:MAG: MerR family transcriptional regulator, partial [Gemmatimonadaceae bacterium]
HTSSSQLEVKGMAMNPGQLSIGAVARLAGVRTSKLRYYESVGLLPCGERVSGRRVYTRQVLDTLALIQFAQDAGFSIPEIRHVLSGFERRTPPSKRWRVVSQRKLDEVRALVARAKRMEGVLEALLACECVRLADCVAGCAPPVTLARARGK